VAERAEDEDETDSFLSQSCAVGREGAGAVEEEEEEWEMLDRLREEAAREQHQNMVKPRESFLPKTAPLPAPAPAQAAAGAAAVLRQPAPPADSKQAKVRLIMADTTLSPAERQRQVNLKPETRNLKPAHTADAETRFQNALTRRVPAEGGRPSPLLHLCKSGLGFMV
jgi:hypothetical protein